MCNVSSIKVLTNIEHSLYDLIGTGNIVVLVTGMSVMYYRLFVMM